MSFSRADDLVDEPELRVCSVGDKDYVKIPVTSKYDGRSRKTSGTGTNPECMHHVHVKSKEPSRDIHTARLPGES